MAQTYAEQLEEVQAAIRAVQTRGQSYTIKDRSFTRANLRELYEREKYLRTMAGREERGGARIRYGTPV